MTVKIPSTRPRPRDRLSGFLQSLTDTTKLTRHVVNRWFQPRPDRPSVSGQEEATCEAAHNRAKNPADQTPFRCSVTTCP